MTGPEFSEEQIERYSRHILLPELGGRGQRKLLDSSAFVIGAGGLGSPALMYLAAAGVGRLGVADGDRVELSNLQRQVIHTTPDLGRPKARSAAETIAAINPDCRVEPLETRLDVDNVRETLRGYDVVLDGSDNFPTRFLVADCCRLEGIPLVSAAVLRFEGQLLTVLPREGASCYRCLFPEPPPPGLVPSCQEAGVLGAVVGAMGTLQAAEAIKVLTGIGRPLWDRLLVYDALEAHFRTLRRAPDPDCPLCGRSPTITDLVEYQYSCETPPEGGGSG
ncbi:MAG: HesA/MoeB/ThiF family protein [Planctomycetota bacterium]|jgi:adenylyltransferase/sulfurtransferase